MVRIRQDRFFREMGFSFSDMNKLSVSPAVVDLHLQFKAPAAYPQVLTIITKIGTFAPHKVQLVYETLNESGEVINTAETFHIWGGPTAGRLISRRICRMCMRK